MKALSIRTLIIDDNPAIHEDMRKILIPAEVDDVVGDLEADLFGETRAKPLPQYRLDSAFQGKEGLALVQQSLREGDPYAVAFIDVRMPPGWDGIETVERIWREYPELQVVLCTAYSDHSWAEISDRLGSTDNLLILKKPFDPIELHQMANALSRKWSLQRLDREKLQQTNDKLEKTNALLLEKSATLEANLNSLREAQSQLVMAEKLAAIGQLASGLAHEINTPAQFVGANMLFIQKACGSLFRCVEVLTETLTPLLKTAPPGLEKKVAETLRKLDMEYLREEVPAAMQQSLDGLERVSSIVLAMQDFARPALGKKTFVELQPAIESTLIIGSSIWKNIAEIETSFQADMPPLLGFRDELNQVILNLLINATHAIADATQHSNKLGKITIQTCTRGDWTEIKISDTGTGIPAAIRHRIFEPFFTTKEVGKGTGQGLAVAYSVIVDKHKGKLDFTTEVGRGTTFIIRLPRQREEPTSASATC